MKTECGIHAEEAEKQLEAEAEPVVLEDARS
jgi:hypothetical protein